MKKTFFLIQILFFSISLFAQYRISGIITDQVNKPLDGANVLLFTEIDTLHTTQEAISDEKGAWNLSNVQPGNYVIQFVLLGYERQAKNIHLSDDNICLDTVRMKIEPKSLNEVVVIADLLQMGGNKETRLFSSNERARAVSGLELMTNIPHLFLDKLNNKLTTVDMKPLLILCDGKIIDEVDLVGLNPNEIVKADYYSQPPARYRNMGIEAVLSITTKRTKDKGGYVIANLKNGFTTGYGTDIIQGKYSSGNSDYTLRYFIDYRDLNENRLDQQYATELDGKPYQIDRQGENSDYRGQFHIFSGSFSNTKINDHLFSAKAAIALNPGMENFIQNVSGELMTTYTKSNYLSPKLDLYYSKTIGKNQELNLNVVNTYYDNKSERTIYDIATNTESKSYSIISEANYTNDFGKYELSTGVRHFFKNLNENYRSNENDISPQKTYNAFNILYAYAELSGKWNKVSALASVGGEQSWLNISPSEKSYFVFKPILSLTYTLNKVSQFRFVSTTKSFVPDMSLLSQSPAYLDSVFISIGNGNLKPYYIFANSLLYTLNKSPYYFQTSITQSHAPHPYYMVIENKGAYLEKTYSNIDYLNALRYEILFNWQPVKWFTLFAYGAAEYQQSKVTGNPYNHWYFLGNASASIYYKDFALKLQSVKQNQTLAGNLYQTAHDYYGGDITWKKKKWSLVLGCIFTNSPEITETYNKTPVYYKESKVWDNFKGLCYLQFSYTLNYGKNIQRSAKQHLSNEDRDTGVNADNTAKQ